MQATMKNTMLRLKLHKLGGILAPIILNDVLLKNKKQSKLTNGFLVVPKLRKAYWHLWVTCDDLDYDISFFLNEDVMEFKENEYFLSTDRTFHDISF